MAWPEPAHRGSVGVNRPGRAANCSPERARDAMVRPERRKPMQAVTEGDRRKEVRILLDQIQAHPERDWTQARRRIATLNKLIAAPPRPRAH